MIMSRRSMRSISIFLVMIFLFQFFAPIVQTGMAHTPKECKKLLDKYDKKVAKATELNTKLKELEKDQLWQIVKDTLIDATIGGILGGGSAWVILRETSKSIIKKATAAGFVVTGIWSIINSYRKTQTEIDKVEEKRDKINKESAELWKQYLKCMNHDHGSGSGGDGDGNNEDGNSQDGNGSQQGSATPTVPDRPGSFELDARKVAILLRWTNSDSDGGSAITDYEYQIKSSNYNRTRWGDWSSWTSAGTDNLDWITGLSKGVNYAVRMRAVNAVGTSSNTGIQIVKTNK